MTPRRPGPIPRALGQLRVALDDSYLRVARDLGLTPSQAELLCAAMAPVPVGELARTLRCDRTNVTHLVDRAIDRGWVERRQSERDKRSSLVALTPEGERLARRFIKRLEVQLAPMLQTWSDRRQHAVADALHEIAAELDRLRSGEAAREIALPHAKAG